MKLKKKKSKKRVYKGVSNKKHTTFPGSIKKTVLKLAKS